MPSPSDPYNTGQTTSGSQKWIFAQPGGGPPDRQFPPLKPGKRPSPNKRVIWYIVGGVALLCVISGFIFTVPLSFGQQGGTTLAQNISTTIAKGQPGAAGSPTSPFTPGPYDATNGRLFSNASPWNAPIGGNAQLDPHSSGMVSQLTDCCHVPTLFRFGMPIYTSTASDPSYTVQDDGNDSLFTSYQPIHIPNDAAPSTGSDHWLFIYDQTKNLIFEMWDTHKSGSTWTTQTGNVYSPTGDGVLQVNGSQQSGNGASYFGGVVTDADIQRGFINHALAFASQYTSASWRYPMNASDGHGTDPNDLPMGARIQLDPSINCKTLPGASSGEKMVCQALETYGGYIRDTGGVTLSMYFEGEDLKDPARNPPDGSPGNPGRAGGIFDTVGLHDGKDLANIPWDKLRVLNAWNSSTALNTMPAPALSTLHTLPDTQNLGITAVKTLLNLPNLTHLAIAEDANSKRWLNVTR